jgi:predicted signal transduction protein with EAL and GGDEF domain
LSIWIVLNPLTTITAIKQGISYCGKPLCALKMAYTNIECGVSIGVALFPDHGTTSMQLLQRADTAMYCAKRSQTQQWQLYCAAMDQL